MTNTDAQTDLTAVSDAYLAEQFAHSAEFLNPAGKRYHQRVVAEIARRQYR